MTVDQTQMLFKHTTYTGSFLDHTDKSSTAVVRGGFWDLEEKCGVGVGVGAPMTDGEERGGAKNPKANQLRFPFFACLFVCLFSFTLISKVLAELDVIRVNCHGGPCHPINPSLITRHFLSHPLDPQL
jgi:hypothetical protein